MPFPESTLIPPFRHALSIRTHLVGLVLILLIPALAFLAHEFGEEAARIRAETGLAALRLARVTASDTARLITETRIFLSEFATHAGVHELDPNRCDPMFTDFHKLHPGYANLLSKLPDGLIVCSALALPGPNARQTNPAISIDEVKRTRAFVIGRPNRGFISNRWVVTLEYPLLAENGELRGMVGAAVDLVRFNPLVGDSAFRNLPQGTLAALIDDQGVILARSHDPERWVGTTVSRPSLIAEILKTRERVSTLRSSIDGIERVFAFVPVEGTRWMATVGIPTAPMEATIKEILSGWLVATTAWLGATLLLTLGLGRRIARPIMAVAGTARLVGNGRFDQRTSAVAKSGVAEVAEVARQFDAMLDSLERERGRVADSEALLRESQRVAGVGSYVFDVASGRWTSTEVLDDIFGINADYDRTIGGWLTLVHPEYRHELAAYLRHHVLEGRQPFDKEYLVRRISDGTTRWVHGLGTLDLDDTGVPVRMIGTIQDVTTRRQVEEHVRSLAFFDPLTRLPNRRLLRERLDQALASAARRDGHGAVMVLDIDHFKTLNDTRGHDMGDELLSRAAERLLGCVRARDCVGRLGGDEFVIILEALNSAVGAAAIEAEEIAEAVLTSFRTPFALGTNEYYCTTSIGICLFRGNTEGPDELLKRADAAMYRVKSDGRNSMRFFDPAMEAALEARMTLEAELRRACTLHQFILYYQPQFDHHRRIIGAEALLRWQHPERGVVPPGEFIALTEETNLIIPIGGWVLNTACALLRGRRGYPGGDALCLSVNVSARQFRQPDFVAVVTGIIERSGVPPTRIKLELTESLILDNVPDTIRKMRSLNELGVKFSMDDFGTGYSSLAYLKQLPFSQIKIDRSFVHDVTTDPNHAVIVRTIIGMARCLGMQVIAEGVETDAQFEFLKAHGCEAFQGYLFGHPLPEAEFLAQLHDLPALAFRSDG